MDSFFNDVKAKEVELVKALILLNDEKFTRACHH